MRPLGGAVEEAGGEHKALASTVDLRLEYGSESFINLLDYIAQKDRTNQNARADIIVDGNILARDVPAVTLLSLEDMLNKKRAEYQAAPTLPVTVEWEADDQAPFPNVYRTKRPEVTTKTEKTFESKILVAPTDKHPAQIEKWTIDQPVGKYSVTKVSGMWTSARKAAVLANCDKLILAVKQARARANQTEVVSVHIGKTLVDFMEARG